jgi:hypothetical protein
MKIKIILGTILVFCTIAIATTWEDITNPTNAISIINLTTNDLYVQGVKFKAAYTNSLGNTVYTTNDLSMTLSREQINLMVIRGLYQEIQAKKLTNIVSGHVPVANF